MAQRARQLSPGVPVSGDPAAAPPAGRLTPAARFKLAVQRNRAAGFALAAVLAFAFRAVGALHISYWTIAGICVTAIASAGLLWWLIRRGLDERLRVGIDAVWLVGDALLITWGVAATGGATSPWFPWYLANIAGAAFVKGQRAAALVAGLDTVAYLGALAFLGDITALDLSFAEALARMAFLYGASFFFLRGVALLQEKRRVIKRMSLEERRRVEELTRLTTALDQRTRELADANLRIREADRAKSQFLANMSHELRTPLNSIIGFSDVLQARLEDALEPRYRRFLENINSSGQHLLGIINDILDLSKIEAGKMVLSPEAFVLRPVVDGVCLVMRGIAAKHRIAFEVDAPADLPPIEADPVKVKQILYNLLSNAVKFSHPDDTVLIQVRRLEAPDSPIGVESFEIAVVDRGIGIDPRDHRVIFEEFTQADAAPTRQFGGTGLGLALVRRFVELHRGSIEVDSAPGVGSTFTVHLPRRFRGEGSVLRDGAPETLRLPLEGGTRILVVEDDPTAYEALAARLSAAAYIPVRARTAEEAVRLAGVLRPAAITLDVILPDGDGFEILSTLKGSDETAAIPVVIVSVLDNRELGLALGAADYFLKPVDGEQLARRLMELVPARPSEPRNLLVIDDDPMLHDVLRDQLGNRGFELQFATSGQEGIESARAAAPDCIVLDLMMDGMDGFEVATVLRGDARTAGIPVVVFTAMELGADERRALRGKIAALVSKGEVPGTGLVPVLEDVLRRPARGALHDDR